MSGSPPPARKKLADGTTVDLPEKGMAAVGKVPPAGAVLGRLDPRYAVELTAVVRLVSN